MLYTPLLPGRGGGHAGAAPRRRAAARGARAHRPAARARRRRATRRATTRSQVRRSRAHDRGARTTTTSSSRSARVSRTLPDPRPGRARASASSRCPRRSRCATACCARWRSPRRSTTPSEREQWLTYVFVGAGYAGLEGLAELQDFAADVIDLYPRCRMQGMRWILVEARDRVMPEIPADARRLRRCASCAAAASRSARARRSSAVTGDAARRSPTARSIPTPHASSGRRASSRTRSSRELGLPLDDHGRIEVDRTTARRRATTNVWAIGDAAAVPDPAPRRAARRRRPRQHAIRQGRRVGAQRRRGASAAAGRKPVHLQDARACSSTWAAARPSPTTLGIRWRGSRPGCWPAPTTWRCMPGTKRKLRLLVDWNVELLFGRDASELGQLGHPPGLDRPPRPAAARAPAADGVDAGDAR